MSINVILLIQKCLMTLLISKHICKVFFSLNILTDHFQHVTWSNPQISALTANVYIFFKFADRIILFCGKACINDRISIFRIFIVRVYLYHIVSFVSISISMQNEWLDPIFFGFRTCFVIKSVIGTEDLIFSTSFDHCLWQILFWYRHWCLFVCLSNVKEKNLV